MSKLRSTISALALAIQVRLPVLIWGSPGTGKSATMRAIAKALDLPIEVVIASVREPSDFAGLPVIREHGVDLAPPNWARRLAEAGKGMLFFDEASCTPPAVQAAMLRVVHEGVVGDLTLPREISVVAAANPPEEAAGGWDLSPPMANRFVHLDWPIDPAMWSEGMVSGWPDPPCPYLPSSWAGHRIASRAMVAGYIQARPTSLQKLPEDERQRGRAWPSERTWEMVSTMRAACLAAGAGDEVQNLLIYGCIGEGAGRAYIHWQKEIDLPDPEELIEDAIRGKLRWTPPDRGDKLYAILGGVAGAVINRMTPERWHAAWQILERGAMQQQDIAAASARPLAKFRASNPRLPAPLEAGRLLPLMKAAGMI